MNCHVSVMQQQKIIIPNTNGEKLVGILHETGSMEIVILCHGFRSTKVSNRAEWPKVGILQNSLVKLHGLI